MVPQLLRTAQTASLALSKRTFLPQTKLSRGVYSQTFQRRTPWTTLARTSFLLSFVGGLSYLLSLKNPVALDNGHVERISYQDIAKHSSVKSCWIIIGGKVYDVTGFLAAHPGGSKVILQHAGKDVTQFYESLHSPGLLTRMLAPEAFVGYVGPDSLPQPDLNPITDANYDDRLPPIASILSLEDMEAVAQVALDESTWMYYHGAAEDEYTMAGNRQAFKHYWFRPRVLKGVENVDPSTKILGLPTALPIYISPAAWAGLGHPLGEVNLTKAAGRSGIIQGVSAAASRSIEDIAAARVQNQTLFYQLYLTRDHVASERNVRKAEELGFRAVMLTVDTPVLGKREGDMRVKGLLFDPDGEPQLPSYFDANVAWSNVKELKTWIKLPIIIKGIQSVEDVELAMNYGVQGVVLSNHGGRQLEFAPASIDVLAELRQRRPDILDEKKLEIYIDGGVRRGTDVLKALCLGATAVGLGRPFLFGNAAYGEEGARHVISIMEDEIIRGMRLLGVTRLEQLKPEMLRYLERDVHLPAARLPRQKPV